MLDFLKNSLLDPAFVDTYRAAPEDFTRRRPGGLPFDRLVMFLLGAFTGSMRRELAYAFGPLTLCPDAGALTRARAKLLPGVFRRLLTDLLAFVETVRPGPRWMGHRLLAFDSSTLRLPKLTHLAEHFGRLGHDDSACPQARLGTLFEVMTGVPVAARLSPVRTSERQQLTELTSCVHSGDLLLMDRGFPANWLFAWILHHGADFCMRVDWGLWAKFSADLRLGADRERIVAVPISAATRRKLAHWGVTAPAALTLRFVKVTLKTGEPELLVTSLLDVERYPLHLLRDLYGRRWAIEEGYKNLKSRLGVEHFTGRTVHAIEQDVHAKVLLQAINALLCHHVDFMRSEPRGRYHRQTNRTFGLSQWRQLLAAFQQEVADLSDRIEVFAAALLRNADAIRPDRLFPRDLQRSRRSPAMAYKGAA